MVGGRWFGALVLIVACAASWPGRTAPRRVELHHGPFPRLQFRHPEVFRRPGFRWRRIVPVPPPPLLLPPPPPDENLPPPGVGPSPLIEDQPEIVPGLPHGFNLTVAVGGRPAAIAPATLARYSEVGQALAACFAPLANASWRSATLRVSFRRDGTVFGAPLLPYIDAQTAEQKSDLAHSLLDTLKTCTPLSLSPSLGASIAGEIFAIRFIHARTNDDRH